ncbi:hypothetical protein KXQ82_02820 [Mucilaginibacter sp. HMF5004]|uniref:hypothetical protein n=1 Tax=Mucilaginibacter rivuli TaxID=2857527 RepID=UPI001C5E8AE5|nr:hypothetical protein [Mucilaginibacter rivuli]MBW4888626.1 hypothetical protein [Mucilaginibacter rivuli]
MPVPGRKMGNGIAVSRNVYVYELTTTAQTVQQATFFTVIKTKLIAKTQSDANGNYSMSLPPGDYTVFLEQKIACMPIALTGKGIFAR